MKALGLLLFAGDKAASPAMTAVIPDTDGSHLAGIGLRTVHARSRS